MPGASSVTTTAQLETALAAASPGTTVTASATTYVLKESLRIPEGVTLEGAGTMTFDGAGRPAGLSGAGTRLRAGPKLVGDVVSLANGARLRRVIVEDVPSRSGNLILVCSAKPGDVVSATVEECEIHNPHGSGAGPEGPVGRGILVFTRNPGRELSPGPDQGASVSLILERSLIRSPQRGSGVFATNFAPLARVELRLEGNVIGGGLDAQGGVSRPDTVHGSQTLIHSLSNLYRSDSPGGGGTGWALRGGATPPTDAIKPTAVEDNAVVLASTGDRLEGFDRGLYAGGGLRSFGSPVGPANRNGADLTLNGTIFSGSAVADVVLIGGEAGHPGPGKPDFPPGDGNEVRLALSGVAASVPSGGTSLANVCKDAAKSGGAPLAPGAQGVGNKVVVTGVSPFPGIP